MRHYEIHRAVLELKETIATKLRETAFNEESDILTKAIEQKKFINFIRSEMTEEGTLKDIKEYSNKKLTVIPSKINHTDFLIVFFDKDIDDEIHNLYIDNETKKLYLNDEEVIGNE